MLDIHHYMSVGLVSIKYLLKLACICGTIKEFDKQMNSISDFTTTTTNTTEGCFMGFDFRIWYWIEKKMNHPALSQVFINMKTANQQKLEKKNQRVN